MRRMAELLTFAFKIVLKSFWLLLTRIPLTVFSKILLILSSLGTNFLEENFVI